MKRKSARWVGGLLAAVLVASAVLTFGACVHDADDCRNTRTCVPPPCSMDAGDPLDGTDAGCCKQQDGGLVCAS